MTAEENTNSKLCISVFRKKRLLNDVTQNSYIHEANGIGTARVTLKDLRSILESNINSINTQRWKWV